MVLIAFGSILLLGSSTFFGFVLILIGLLLRATKEKTASIRRKTTFSGGCYNCKHCNTCSNEKGEVYCNWDSTYYYPETGINCDSFCK